MRGGPVTSLACNGSEQHQRQFGLRKALWADPCSQNDQSVALFSDRSAGTVARGLHLDWVYDEYADPAATRPE